MQTRVSFILIFLFIMLLPMRVNSQIVTGAEQMDQYLPLLKGKRIGMVVNHTSVVGRKQVHLLDTLLKREVRVVKVFAPEHGFRGNADAGETVKDGKDSRTGIPIVSLYGDNKKPSAAQLKDVDVIVFDIQDVAHLIRNTEVSLLLPAPYPVLTKIRCTKVSPVMGKTSGI